MPDLTLVTSSYNRDSGGFPRLRVINMFAEQVPTEPAIALLSRPGLVNADITMGLGPVKGLFRIDGVLDNALIGVSGSDFYDSETLVGPIDGSGPVSLAGYEDRVFVNAGNHIYEYNGTTLTQLAFPDSTPVSNICVGASRLVAVRADTGRFYWSDPLTDTVSALSFATAENSPDKLKACLFLGDTLLLFGTETVEFWPVNSDPDLPFQPLVGHVFQRGIRDTDCATLFSSSFAWISDINQVCVGDPQNVISDPALEERLSKSTVARLWRFELEGTEFLALTLDDTTYVFSTKSSQWSEFETYNETNWIPRCYAGGLFGSMKDGEVVEWWRNSAGQYIYDDFGTLGGFERRFIAGMPIQSGLTPIHNLILRVDAGSTPFATGDGINPIIEMRTSKDGGFVWTPYKQRTLGTMGAYRHKVTWRGLGYFGHPGFLAEFRVTDDVPFRVSGAVVNEEYADIQ